MIASLYGCTPLIAVAIGVLGLLGASWPRQRLEAWVNIHALFGLLLCGFIGVRLIIGILSGVWSKKLESSER